jgi:hypothetical protein
MNNASLHAMLLMLATASAAAQGAPSDATRPLAVPMPDSIDHEATAGFRRSTKQGSEGFRWSCRLQQPEANCF